MSQNILQNLRSDFFISQVSKLSIPPLKKKKNYYHKVNTATMGIMFSKEEKYFLLTYKKRASISTYEVNSNPTNCDLRVSLPCEVGLKKMG